MVDISEKNQKDKILIAGPCVIESLDLCVKIAKEVKRVAEEYGYKPIFKASYDKANRTSANSFRGIGMIDGIRILDQVRFITGLPFITDVHDVEQVKYVSQFSDYLQIPAFLCRQTDLIEACAKSGLPTLVKKGQFLSPESCKFIEEKFYKNSGSQMMICERGNSFGYNDLIVDVTSISRLKQSCTNSSVIMDCTHSLQRPNTSSGKTEGRGDMIEDMVKFASIMNADGLFIETHPSPSESPSDSENILELSSLESIISISKKIYDIGKKV